MSVHSKENREEYMAIPCGGLKLFSALLLTFVCSISSYILWKISLRFPNYNVSFKIYSCIIALAVILLYVAFSSGSKCKIFWPLDWFFDKYWHRNVVGHSIVYFHNKDGEIAELLHNSIRDLYEAVYETARYRENLAHEKTAFIVFSLGGWGNHKNGEVFKQYDNGSLYKLNVRLRDDPNVNRVWIIDSSGTKVCTGLSYAFKIFESLPNGCKNFYWQTWVQDQLEKSEPKQE